ncbi:MAG: iron-sulfur cluster repair di-iron protein [Acidimicrobiia bacterium]|jgi:regulator of cell morphogenesis and NO signaling|nr:iron-sulfur cluster repair di-iron protein [Acidimicrobiia bacterium]MBP8180156.1 iron-sulfur cluster repair di-iron protein [Acidimicrobiia bacterium]
MTTDLTLAAIVDANPLTTRILERHQLDYCCGGQRTLQQACDELGLDADTIIIELESLDAAQPADWTSLSPAQLVDRIEATHHRYLHEELPRLAALAHKVAGVHGWRHPELNELHTAYLALEQDLKPHLMKEERVLFPMIRELDAATAAPAFHCGSLRNPISMMLIEHDRAGELLAQLRGLSNGYLVPDDACASYKALFVGLEELEADTHLHVHIENNVLFPAVLGLETQLTEATS